MSKARKLKVQQRQQSNESAEVPNPTELPEEFNQEGDPVPAAPVAVEVFDQEEITFLLHTIAEKQDFSPPPKSQAEMVERIKSKLGALE